MYSWGMNLQATAYHEAGHAVAKYVLRFDIKGVTIVPDKDSVGSVSGKLGLQLRVLADGFLSRATVAKWHDLVVTIMAGREAQRRFNPRSIRHYMASADREAAVRILSRLHPEEGGELRAAFKFLEARTRNLVGHWKHWGQIQDLAEALIAKRTLSGHEAKAVLAGSLRRQMIEDQADR
jgi:hypothetical protein